MNPDESDAARGGIAIWRVVLASLSGTVGFPFCLAVAFLIWADGTLSRVPGCEIPMRGPCIDVAPTSFAIAAFLLIAPWLVVVLAAGGRRIWVWPTLAVLVAAAVRLYGVWLGGADFLTLAWLTDPLF